MENNNETTLITVPTTDLPIEKRILVNIDDDTFDLDPFDDKYIITEKNVEDMGHYFKNRVKRSFEYTWYINFLKKTLNVRSCVYFKNYSIDNGMGLEFHHHPFTMWEYVVTVINKQLKVKEWVRENEVEKEVMMLHYQLKVGLVPLNPTAHSAYHDGILGEIHPDLIIGNYEQFYKEYQEFIPDITKEKYLTYVSKFHDNKDLVYPEIFEYKPTNIRTSNKDIITIDTIDKLLIEDKLKNIESLQKK